MYIRNIFLLYSDNKINKNRYNKLKKKTNFDLHCTTSEGESLRQLRELLRTDVVYNYC